MCQGLSFDSQHRLSGFTLIELMVTMVILSIMASVAIPYAELSVTRSNEYQLKYSLRELRSAIDHFHADWQAEYIPQDEAIASPDGYPRNLEILVNGVDDAVTVSAKRYYLRRIPKNPFVDPTQPVREHWLLRSYQDAPDAIFWGGQDVYDIIPNTDKMAIDGTYYKTW